MSIVFVNIISRQQCARKNRFGHFFILGNGRARLTAEQDMTRCQSTRPIGFRGHSSIVYYTTLSIHIIIIIIIIIFADPIIDFSIFS